MIDIVDVSSLTSISEGHVITHRTEGTLACIITQFLVPTKLDQLQRSDLGGPTCAARLNTRFSLCTFTPFRVHHIPVSPQGCA